MPDFMARADGTDAAQTEHAPEEPADHPASGADRDPSLRDLIKAFGIHGESPSRLRAAVEARRQDDVESPSSIVMLL
jgi:hypothetical protein